MGNCIDDCHHTSMSGIEETDRKSELIFVGDLNAHPSDWLGSISPTDVHSRVALDFFQSPCL